MSAQKPTSVRSESTSASSENGADPLRVRLTPPAASGIWRIVLILIVAALALYLVYRIRSTIRLLAIASFFAFALFPVVDAVAARTKARRGIVILVVYLLLAVLVALIGYVVIPSLIGELHSLSRNAPHYAAELRRNAAFRRYDNRYHITAKLVRGARRLPELLAGLAGPLKDVTVGAFGFVTQLLAVLSITYLLTSHGREYAELGLKLTGRRQERYRRVLIDIKDAVAGYTLGNIIISVLATIATWIVLSILGVPYALALGFVVGFFDLIPLIGATLGAIIISLATLPVNFPTATIVWIVFIILWQRFEDYVVQPLVYRRALKVNPIVTIVSLLIGGELLGILGVLLAIPTAAAIQIILRDWWAAREEQKTRTTAGDQAGRPDASAANPESPAEAASADDRAEATSPG
jgi:predicted PurR-regulated permease PerM